MLCHKPELVRRMFPVTDFNPNGAQSPTLHRRPRADILPADIHPCWLLVAAGAYQVRLCKDGVWVNVLLDDHFPCTMYGTLAYTSAARRQLWIALLEKAAAKLYGCYEAMSGGSVAEALALFTGFPTERIMLDKLQGGDTEAAEGGSDAETDANFLWVKLMSFHQVVDWCFGYVGCWLSCLLR